MSVRLFEAQINSLLALAIVILTDPNLSKHGTVTSLNSPFAL